MTAVAQGFSIFTEDNRTLQRIVHEIKTNKTSMQMVSGLSHETILRKRPFGCQLD